MFLTYEVNQLKTKTVELNMEKEKLIEASKVAEIETKELQKKLSEVEMVLEDKIIRKLMELHLS